MITEPFLTKLYTRILLLALFIICFQPGHAQIYQGYCEIPHLDVQPEIDGIIDPGEWDGAVHFSGFTGWTLDWYIPEKTEVLAGYDDENIYLSFRGFFLDKKLFDDFIEAHKPVDSHMWGRTYFGVSLSGGDSSIQVKCGPTLSRMDFRNGDLSWNGAWDFRAVVHDDHWIGEYSIPFSDLGLEEAPEDQQWTMGLVHSNPSGESSRWNGHIKFVRSKDLYVDFMPWSTPLPGKNSLRVNIQNLGSGSGHLVFQINLIPFVGYPDFVNQSGQGNNPDMILGMQSKPLTTEITVVIEGNKTLKQFIEFDLPSEGNYYASALCRDENGRLIRQSRGFWFGLKPNGQRMQDTEKKLGEGLSTIRQLPASRQGELHDRANKLRSRHFELSKALPCYWEKQKWEMFTKRVDSLETEILRFLHMAKLASAGLYETGNTFGVSTTHSINKLRKDAELLGQINESICLSGARNEYESFQVVILPLDGDLTNVEILASDIYGTDGNIISNENIEIFLVEYNLINWQANYVNKQKGWHPDPLIPIDSYFNLDGRDLCRPVWVTIHVPENTPPGIYRGQVIVSANEKEHHTVQVELRVWDFQLSQESHLKTHTWDDIGTMADFYNVDVLPVEWYMNFCDVLLKNRLNPSFAGVNYLNRHPEDGTYDFSRVEKILENAISNGMSRFSLIQMKKGEYQQAELEAELHFIKAYTDFLRTKGWLDRALVEIWDEPTVLQWEMVKKRAEKIKEISPDIRIQLFAGGSEPYMFWEPSISSKYGLHELIDIWAPHLLVNAPELQREGKEIWTYFCTLARSNAPNLYIDTPPIYQRTIPWYCWMHGVDGFEHWSTTYFWRNTHKGLSPDQKWPNIPWDSRTFHDFHGEGQLVYPGPQGKIFPSMRLEIFRDGMEDYEYLYKLRELLKSSPMAGEHELLHSEAEDLLRIGEYLLIQYSHDVQITLENTIRLPNRPELILETRQKIALAIEQLQSLHSIP